MIDVDAAARAALARLERGRLPRVCVVGDVILDQFLYGAVERISPEAPVPVVDVQREVFRLGGSANVVCNLRSLGAEVALVGVVGADGTADGVREQLGRLGVDGDGLVEIRDRPTAVKTRVIAQHQQVVRFDRERRGRLDEAAAARVADRVLARLAGADALIVSDYGKGVVDGRLLDAVVPPARRRGVLVAVDPKPVNAALYRGVDVTTPNARETEAMAGAPAREDDEAETAGRRLLEMLDSRAVLVTRGERGMTLVERSGAATHIPTRARDVFDVTGAGDTAISVLALAWAAGASPAEAACLANLASGLVVGKLGTAAVTLQELRDAADGRPGPGTAADPH